MKKTFLLVFFGLVTVAARAQQLPVYSQFFLNPLVYNPAYAGAGGYAEFFLTHRRQWVGLEGAPVTSALSVHLPTRNRWAFGLNLTNDQRGLLTASTGQLVVSNRVQLGEKHYLGAGLSLGAGGNGIDWRQLDESYGNDAALALAVDHRLYLDGGVGLRYEYQALQLGVSLPNAFRSDQLDKARSNRLGFNQLKYYLLTGSYRFQRGDFVVEPHLIYRLAEGIPGHVEAVGIVRWRELLWVGGSYRQGYGPAFFLGTKFKERYQLGYAYETGSRQVKGLPLGTHEVVLSLRVGSPKRGAEPLHEASAAEAINAPTAGASAKDAVRAPSPTPTKTPGKASFPSPGKPAENGKGTPAPKPASPTPATGKTTAKANTPPLKQTGQNAGPVAPKPPAAVPASGVPASGQKPPTSPLEKKLRARESSQKWELKKGHYVVVGTFRVLDNAVRSEQQLRAKGYACHYGYSSESLVYYVYLEGKYNLEQARQKRDEIRRVSSFASTWLLSVE